VGGLGSRRPTQLLAEMMELCPDDEEASCFFVFLFLQRLPAWLRVQLAADDQANIRQLVTRADRLFAWGSPAGVSTGWSCPSRAAVSHGHFYSQMCSLP
jgi:hypothetical protein